MVHVRRAKYGRSGWKLRQPKSAKNAPSAGRSRRQTKGMRGAPPRFLQQVPTSGAPASWALERVFRDGARAARGTWLRCGDAAASGYAAGSRTMIPTTTRILVCTEPVDMRRSFDGLTGCTRELVDQGQTRSACERFGATHSPSALPAELRGQETARLRLRGGQWLDREAHADPGHGPVKQLAIKRRERFDLSSKTHSQAPGRAERAWSARTPATPRCRPAPRAMAAERGARRRSERARRSLAGRCCDRRTRQLGPQRRDGHRAHPGRPRKQHRRIMLAASDRIILAAMDRIILPGPGRDQIARPSPALLWAPARRRRRVCGRAMDGGPARALLDGYRCVSARRRNGDARIDFVAA